MHVRHAHHTYERAGYNVRMDITLSAHAYLVRSRHGARPVLDGLAAQGIAVQGNPDCLVRECDELSVSDARDIASFAHYTPVGEKKFVVIAAASLTREAQNALLKIVEEGSGRTTFFFVLEPGVAVLPTLVSRCVVVQEAVEDNSAQSVGEEFLSLQYKDRLARAEQFGKDGDRDGARTLVRSLLASGTFPPPLLRDLIDAEQYLALSGSSPKGVIGHLALVLP